MTAADASSRADRRPGAKRRRHKRWTRVTLWFTVMALGAFAFATVSLCSTLGRDEKAESTSALLEKLTLALKGAHQDHGVLPEYLLNLPAVARGEIGREDAFGTTIRYVVLDRAAGSFDLRSAGPDKAFDTDDDVTVTIPTR